MEAVSEIVLGVRVAGRRRNSEPVHRDALRPWNSEAVSVPQSEVVLRDIMVGQGGLVNGNFRCFPRISWKKSATPIR
jgi:hypothetical protein